LGTVSCRSPIGLANKPNFYNYTYRDEMISDAIENCIMYIDTFNPDRTTNPFAYFTQTIYNAFLRRITREKKQTYIKYKNIQNHQLTEQLVNNTYVAENNEVMNVFIKDFEESAANKKAKALKGLDVIFDQDEKKTE
jgi:DNA-directed RNA polymerase specialized sigma24 family protein